MAANLLIYGQSAMQKLVLSPSNEGSIVDRKGGRYSFDLIGWTDTNQIQKLQSATDKIGGQF